MSYQKIRSFSFSKDFNSFTTTHACNNVLPLDYYKTKIDKKDDESTEDFVSDTIKLFIEGSYQFNNEKNIISFTINKVIEENGFSGNRDLWGSYGDTEEQRQKIESNLNKVCLETYYALRDKKYNSLFKQLKKEVYVLSNGYNFITRKGKTSFSYSNNADNAKEFDGLDKILMKNYFALTEYNYNFVICSYS